MGNNRRKKQYSVEYVGWFANCEEPRNGEPEKPCGRVVQGHTRYDAERSIRVHIKQEHR